VLPIPADPALGGTEPCVLATRFEFGAALRTTPDRFHWLMIRVTMPTERDAAMNKVWQMRHASTPAPQVAPMGVGDRVACRE
jgi:hypothetical protein